MQPVSRRTLNYLRVAANADFSTVHVASSRRRVHSQTTSCSRAAALRFRPALNPTSSCRRYSTAATGASSTHAREEPFKPTATTSSSPPSHYSFFPRTLPDGPPPAGAFAVDVRALRREFLQLQASAHPDRHAQADKARAQALSARINEAYKTLQSPLLRAQYLLAQRGHDVGGDETAKVEDPELLMEVLEAREEIEAAETEEEIAEMKRVNDGKVEASVRLLEEAFERDDVEVAKTECVKLRYWVNILESLNAWEKGKPVVLVH